MNADPTPSVTRQAARCAARVVILLMHRRLHLRRDRVGRGVTLADGRAFRVFRESTCDGNPAAPTVTLAVWFRLRSIPPGARARRWLFERLCILNTVLFAGFDGYLVKLWMVNPKTSDYAGLYSWRSADEADRYGRYITAVLRPLSRAGSVGFTIEPETPLDAYLARGEAAAS
jgi:hypothetical protein